MHQLARLLYEAAEQNKHPSAEQIIDTAFRLYEIVEVDRKAGIKEISPGAIKVIMKGFERD